MHRAEQVSKLCRNPAPSRKESTRHRLLVSLFLFVCAVALAAPSALAQDVLQVAGDHARLILENDRVRILEVKQVVFAVRLGGRTFSSNRIRGPFDRALAAC